MPKRMKDEARPKSSLRQTGQASDHSKPWCILTALAEHRGPLNVRDLAKITGHTPKSIYANIAQWPVLNVGTGTIRFDPAAVSAWLCERNPGLKRVHRELQKASETAA